MRTTRKILAILLVLCMTASFAACGGSEDVADILDEIPTLSTGDESTDDVSVADPEPSEGQTRMPVITHLYNSGVSTLVIAGTCEADSVVTATIMGGDSVTVNADGTRFALEIELGDRSEPNIYVTATAPDLTESEAKIVTGDVDSNNRGNKQFPTILADNFVLFSQSSIDALSDDNAQSNETIKNFKDSGTTGMKAFLKNLSKAGDTELIFVLSPSRARVLADYLPEDVTIDEFSLYNQVKKALIDCGVTVIDLREVFGVVEEVLADVSDEESSAESSEDISVEGPAADDTVDTDYPLFYNTHSGWSDYAAYLAYTEVMNYIAESFPAAAPRGIEEFVINEVENALLGDLAYYFKLNKENALNYDPYSEVYFTETYYDFVLEGLLDIGNNYVYPEDEDIAEDSSADSSEDTSDDSSEDSSVDSSADSSEDSISSEDTSEEEARKEFLESLICISDVGLYLDTANYDYRFYNQYFTAKETYVDPDVVLSDSAFGFYTNRSELPSAHIYRSEYCTPIVDMLAERFNNSYFSEAGDFNIKHNSATKYAGTEGNDNVDYIIVFITEEELVELF